MQNTICWDSGGALHGKTNNNLRTQRAEIAGLQAGLKLSDQSFYLESHHRRHHNLNESFRLLVASALKTDLVLSWNPCLGSGTLPGIIVSP